MKHQPTYRGYVLLTIAHLVGVNWETKADLGPYQREKGSDSGRDLWGDDEAVNKICW